MCLPPPPAVPPLWLLRRAQRGPLAASGESKKRAIIPQFSAEIVFVSLCQLDLRVGRSGLSPFGPTSDLASFGLLYRPESGI